MSLSVGFADKVCEADEALSRVQALRQLGPVVFTNGVFDVLHRGHATYLEQARALGAVLVVGSTPTRLPSAWAKGLSAP